LSAARLLRLWAPLVGFQALIFVLSSRPQVPLGVSVWDKALHFGAYAFLALLWGHALSGGTWVIGPGKAAACALLALLFGVSDEVHQSFVPGRVASVGDVVADGLGAAVAAGLLLLWSSRAAGKGAAVDRI
jgi:VanZ family protein